MKNVKQVIENTDWKMLQEHKHLLVALAQTQVGAQAGPALDGILNFLDAIQDAVVNDELVKEEVMFPATPE